MDETPTTTTPPTPTALLLKVPEACEMLSLGRSTIYLLMDEGELEQVHIGRSVRITTESARAFVQRRRAGAHDVPLR